MRTLTDEDVTGVLNDLAASFQPPGHGPGEIVAGVSDGPQPLSALRRLRVWVGATACLLLLGALFAVLSRPNGSGSSGSPLGQVSHSVAGAGRQSTAGVATGLAPMQAPAAGPAVRGLSGDSRTAPAVGAPPVDGGAGRVVKSGTISLLVKDKAVPPTLTAIDRMATADGGYVAESSDESGASPSGQVTIRVPAAKFERLLADIRGLDAKVLSASTTGKDVSAQYTDLESQLGTLRAARQRFLTILGQAKTIGETLTVQQRVDEVSGQIDSIEGQRRLLASQSDLSTLSVSVSQAGDPVLAASQPPRSGLSQAFSDAWDGFVSGVEAIIARSGRAAVILLCLGIVLMVARTGWRLARRRTI